MQLNNLIIDNFENVYRRKFPTRELFEMAKLLLIDTLAHPITQKHLETRKTTLENIFSYCHYFTIQRLGNEEQMRNIQLPPTIPIQTSEEFDAKLHQRNGDRDNWHVSDVIQIELLNFQHSSYRHRVFLIDQDEASIDRDIVIVIEQINRLGFHTRSCCSGTLRDHPYCKPYNKRNGYISFHGIDKTPNEHEYMEIHDPTFHQLKKQFQKEFNTVFSTSITGNSFALYLKFPIEITDEKICQVWEELHHFITDHQTDLKRFIPQESPLEVIPIGDIDKVLPRAVDLIPVYKAKLEESFPTLTERQRSLVLSFYAGHLLNVNAFQHALEILQESIEIDRRFQDREAEAIKMNNIGSTYRELGNTDQALKYYKSSLEMFYQLNNIEAIQNIEKKIREITGTEILF